MDIINLGEADGLPPVTWETVIEKLEAGSPPDPDAHNARTTWLSTVNDDGSPHVTAVGALWLDGSFWFQTGSVTRKNRNLARDPRCSMAVSVRDADVVAEGQATRETDPATLTPRQGVGRPGVARGSARDRVRYHCPVQRAVPGTAAVERLSHEALFGDRGAGRRAGRADSLQVLTSGCPVMAP